MSLQKNPEIASLVAEAKRNLESTYGTQATIVAAAPGRVNLIGEHIDYCDGFVLPFAIEREIIIAAAPNGTTTARVSTAFDPNGAEIDLSSEISKSSPEWANYIRGVLHHFIDQTGQSIPGFDAFVISSVPAGSGLSSSAAFELATATLCEALTGHKLDTRSKALLAQKAEHTFAGVPCGIMDQFASAFGQKDQLVMIDCRSGEPTMIPFASPDLTVIIANTKVSHQLSDGGYAKRRQQTEDGLRFIGKDSWRNVTEEDLNNHKNDLDPVVFKRSRHVIGEIARTEKAAEALKSNNFEALTELMAASHDSLRDDFEVSCAELDIMVNIARSIGRSGGVIGARMTGGGFGGSTVTLCETSKAEAIADELFKQYKAQTGITPEIFASRPSQGARICNP